MSRRLHLGAAVLAGLAACISAGSTIHAGGSGTERVWIKFKSGRKVEVQQALAGVGARVHHAFDGIDAFAASVPRAALDGIRRNPNIELVEPDVVRMPMSQSRPYGIDLVRAPPLWAQGVTGNGITVCVIDSGLSVTHEDFAGIPVTGYASAGQRWDIDYCGHGSHVAGTLVARDNATGVVGVAPGNVSLHVVKVFDGANCGWTYSSTLLDAANRCAQAGARVINMSLGGPDASSAERDGFQQLYAAGVLSVAAAGNDGNTAHSYPASYDSVISVGAVDAAKVVAGFSQRTDQVELAAPGVAVLSTVPQVSATTTVGGISYVVTALDGTQQLVRSGALVAGGLCTDSGGGSFAGKVVICERGEITFADKAANAYGGGAAGLIVYNNVPGGFNGHLGGPGPGIPVVGMARADGQFLVANALGAAATMSTVPANPGNGYALFNGTSMASPHVAGVAALVWSRQPQWTNAQVREALAVTAEDIGVPGRDDAAGWGLANAEAALAELTGNNPPAPHVSPSGLTIVFKFHKGRKSAAELRWTTGTAAFVDVYRDAAKVTVANDGVYQVTELLYSEGTFKVCVQGSTTACTNAVTEVV